MNDTNEVNAAQIIERLAKQGVKVVVGEKTTDRNARHYALVPTDVRVEELGFLNAEAPDKTYSFIDAESFVSYVKDYIDADESRLFASLERLQLACMIDYVKKCNKPSEAIDGECNHRALFRLKKRRTSRRSVRLTGRHCSSPNLSRF